VWEVQADREVADIVFYLDLFAGIGGFALGAYWAGWRFDSHYFSEVDEYAIKVYRQRFPDAIPLGDIRDIQGLPSGEWIVTGGFPCQDISIAGKGAGIRGERSSLWFEMWRIIRDLQPRWVIIENVGAITFRGLSVVLNSLAEIGFDAEWQDIRASDVGAPHRRERIWIVAYPSEQRARNRCGEIADERGRSGEDRGARWEYAATG
jgi:DNA (cytosine-5)-methyltransferase 1